MDDGLPVGLEYAAESGLSEAVRVRISGRDVGVVTEPGIDPRAAWNQLRDYLRREGLAGWDG